MKLRTTFVLLIMVVIGLTYIILIDSRISTSDQRRAVSGRMLRFDPNHVSRIELEHGRKKIVCERQDGEWFVVDPYKARADQSVINRIIAGVYRMEHFVTISRRDREANKLTLADYGLLPPRAIVRIEGEGFRNLINLGRLSPDSETLYVTLDNTKQDMYGVSSDILDQVPLNFFEYRSRKVFDLDAPSVNRIEVKTESQGFVSLSLNRSGHWIMSQPYEARLDRRQVEALIERILDLEFTAYIDEVEADDTLHGFEEVDTSISLRSEQDLLAREVIFGSPPGSDENLSYARYRSDDSLFTIPAQIVGELLNEFDPQRLRDRRILPATMEDIKALRLGSGSEALEFEMKDDSWTMISPRRWRAESSMIVNLIAAWREAAIVDFIEYSEDDDDPLDFEISTEIAFAIRRARRGDEERGELAWTNLSVGQTDSRGTLVRRNEEPWIYVLDKEDYHIVSYDPLHYRDRTVLSIPRENVQRITLRKGEREQTIVRSPENDSFQIADQEGAAGKKVLDQERLLKLISSLRCAGFLRADSESIKDFGLDQPRASLTLVLRGDAGISNTVIIGDEKEEGLHYARVRGQDTVFLLDQKSVGTILSDLYISIDSE